MIDRTRAGLADIARPALVLAAILGVAGAVTASAGVAAGWYVYLVGFAVSAVAIGSLWVLHVGRIGRAGHAAFAFLVAALVLGTPVIAMVAAFVGGQDALHDLLMPYAMSIAGMVGLFGTLLGYLLVGIVVARAGVVPAAAGVLIAVAPLVDLPVEFGLLPLPVWGLAVVVLAAGFGVAARGVPARAMARAAVMPTTPAGEMAR